MAASPQLTTRWPGCGHVMLIQWKRSTSQPRLMALPDLLLHLRKPAFVLTPAALCMGAIAPPNCAVTDEPMALSTMGSPALSFASTRRTRRPSPRLATPAESRCGGNLDGAARLRGIS